MKSALALVLVAGCSFIGVRGPKQGDDPARCRGSIAAPIVDTAAGGAGILVGTVMLLSAANDEDKGNDAHEMKNGGGVVVAIAGAIYAASAGYGAFTLDKCAAARRRN